MIKNLLFFAFVTLLTSCTTHQQSASPGFQVVEQTLISKGWKKETTYEEGDRTDLYSCESQTCGLNRAYVFVAQFKYSTQESKERLGDFSQNEAASTVKKIIGSKFKSLKITHQEKINTLPKGFRFHITLTDEGERLYFILDIREQDTKGMVVATLASTPQNALKAYRLVPLSAVFQP